MKAVLKHIVAHTYKPLLVKYLSKTRMYRYEDIRLRFHRRFFIPDFFSVHNCCCNIYQTIAFTRQKFFRTGLWQRAYFNSMQQKKEQMLLQQILIMLQLSFLKKTAGRMKRN